MIALHHSLLAALASKILQGILLAGLAAPVAAHTYFFGVSDLSFNDKNQHIEIIHQFTAHDIENTIAEIKQIHFSAEHPKYDEYIQAYFERHFSLEQNHKVITLNWIGFEIRRGHIFTYQESSKANFSADLVVKNTLLVDTYTKQINTVNYQGVSFDPQVKLQGSLTFNKSQRSAEIKALKSQVIISKDTL